MIYLLSLICLVLAGFLVLVTILTFRFSAMLFRFEENINECLDDLDTQYNAMFRILQRPTFYDSPEIKQVITSIKKCRESILNIANKVANIEPELIGKNEEEK